jgi:DNA-binding IclR family transcriptional regulator
MRTTQNKRTLNDVLRYIKTYSHDSVLDKSMMAIAKATGYSNATIHRALKTLEQEGMIQILQTKSQRKPNKIYYLGPDEDDVGDLMQRADLALAKLHDATDEVNEVMQQLRETLHLVQPNTVDEPYIQIQ